MRSGQKSFKQENPECFDAYLLSEFRKIPNIGHTWQGGQFLQILSELQRCHSSRLGWCHPQNLRSNCQPKLHCHSEAQNVGVEKH